MHGKEKVVGMVVVDSAIVRTKLPDGWPTLLADASYFDVVGLEKNRVLSDEEWADLKSNDEEAREALRKRLEDMVEVDKKGQRAHLSLSSQSRFVYAEGHARTHNLQLVYPQLIAGEVRWVLEGK
ncbi:hypothetical protein BDZ45DRAFT_697803 [Acephala macrosclerotiorum]|nr:hypothetical protein BDZ45DRAFT_697803 [Acephala macrosclerotiorum]